MAGVTDRPFRQLCKRLGAGYAVSEMAASNPQLWQTVKSSRRLNHEGEKAQDRLMKVPARLARVADYAQAKQQAREYQFKFLDGRTVSLAA